MSADNNEDRGVFTITRHFKLPLATVWKAWSEADRLRQWWGPKGCVIDLHRFEFRPGGFVHYAMNFEGASAMWGRFNYRDIVPLQDIVWLNSFSNEQCGMARAPFSELCPLEILNSVRFTEQDGQTTVSLRAQAFGATDAEYQYFVELHSSMAQGYGGTFDQLAEYLLPA
ncbi:SRPBCC family protein [Undibacterium sp. TJN25]|uniref:SRPBCC family protein n=1 Tax=Undibacterium sp. TJN25 TaxID=3413056 RepID=UPI003BF2229B